MKLSNLKFLKTCHFLSFLLIVTLINSSCTKSSVLQKADSTAIDEDLVNLELPPWQFPENRLIDILHTRLDLSFDWSSQTVIGKSELLIKPFINNLNSFYLDAKAMDINKVELIKPDSGQILTFDYDSERIYLHFKNALQKGDLISIRIDYLSKPNSFIDGTSSDDKGLFFIDPLDTIDGLMPQIWTQGEPEYNSVWFPTLNRADEKFSQEIYLRVDTSFLTLSNGKLVMKTFNDDGTRTDYWHQEKEHSSYLAMIAVGSWEVIDLNSGKVPLQVYSEPEFAPYMKDIFGNTKEMMDFYSNKFGVAYPWDKYAQIPVRKFVTGAMENTSASVFMDNLYTDSKSLADEDFDWIISHELSHQWFGNLVTCKSWSYISLNESFANYSEYLWAEYKYGPEKAALVRIAELDEYLYEAGIEKKSIIRFRYNKEDELFDAHSYSKGGLVLHMLRRQLGDEVFFDALKIYLMRFSYRNTELSDLRKVFEECSGQNLELFFHQWFYQAGHPQLRIDVSKQEIGKSLIRINQIQKEGLFEFPLKIRNLGRDGSYNDTLVMVKNREQSFEIGIRDSGFVLIADPDHDLLVEIQQDRTYDELMIQYKYSTDFLNRYDAYVVLTDSFPEKVKSTGIIQDFLNDSSYTIQELALNFIDMNYESIGTDSEKRILELLKNSNKSYVRGTALAVLGERQLVDTTFCLTYLEDSSWFVNASALELLIDNKKNRAELMQLVKRFESSLNEHVVSILASFYVSQEEDNTAWFRDKIRRMNDANKYAVLGYYGLALEKAPPEVRTKGIEELYVIAKNDESKYNRIMAFQSLLVFADQPEVKKQLLEILDQEDGQYIRSWLKNML